MTHATICATRATERRRQLHEDTLSKDRKDIYVGDGLRRALAGRKESLSTVVNLIADRYQGLVERSMPKVNDKNLAILRAVLSENRGQRLEAREIAAFPSMVEDWMHLHPPAKPGGYDLLRQDLPEMSYAELVALIDHLERNP